jgi:pyruvate/2-oxoglutarate/acetoin dehydrogenase E1 component
MRRADVVMSYGAAVREGFRYLLANHRDVFVIGQGLWSPWYVGSSMTDLDKEFGTARVIDCPVSEMATTGAAIGASLCGYRPIIVHPRMDFMILATDQIVNGAAKWRYMLGGQSSPKVTIRGIVNRGGEQGAQHSQALHAWYAHIPGLRVVMPATAADARDLLVASVLCDDPVIYIDDRWLYEQEETLGAVDLTPLADVGPRLVREGADVTLVGSSHSTLLCRQAADLLARSGIEADIVDLRVVSPLDVSAVVRSVKKTGRLCAVDGSWENCGLAGEVIAAVAERVSPRDFRASPRRVTLPAAPAPTSRVLEELYYPTPATVASTVRAMVEAAEA